MLRAEEGWERWTETFPILIQPTLSDRVRVAGTEGDPRLERKGGLSRRRVQHNRECSLLDLGDKGPSFAFSSWGGGGWASAAVSRVDGSQIDGALCCPESRVFDPSEVHRDDEWRRRGTASSHGEQGSISGYFKPGWLNAGKHAGPYRYWVLARVSHVRFRGRGGVAVSLLASHLGEAGSIIGRVTLGFSYVGIVPGDAADERVLSGISRFLRPRIPMSLHSHIFSPSLVHRHPNLSSSLHSTRTATSLRGLCHPWPELAASPRRDKQMVSRDTLKAPQVLLHRFTGRKNTPRGAARPLPTSPPSTRAADWKKKTLSDSPAALLVCLDNHSTRPKLGSRPLLSRLSSRRSHTAQIVTSILNHISGKDLMTFLLWTCSSNYQERELGIWGRTRSHKQCSLLISRLVPVESEPNSTTEQRTTPHKLGFQPPQTSSEAEFISFSEYTPALQVARWKHYCSTRSHAEAGFSQASLVRCFIRAWRKSRGATAGQRTPAPGPPTVICFLVGDISRKTDPRTLAHPGNALLSTLKAPPPLPTHLLR
ncbi:hypothetical protein PR048_015769 [Dryococelus australis]|uniref:Uncharacterized protein n=1 Tax=Dryococelus australis TaxID=614101 RepID=A0ABQ9HI58_9NEOP|nr:hypothetical protein PR048_015769 [Dryococelus australis]